MKIPIKDVKKFREEHGLSHLVVFGVDEDGTQHVATHGGTVEQAKQAADAGNRLKAALGWPSDLCKATPLERICGNCKALARLYSAGEHGGCRKLPGYPVKMCAEPACILFEPKG